MCRWPRKLRLLQEAFSDCHSPTATAVTTGLLHCPGQAAPVSTEDLQHMRLTTQKYHFNRLKPSNTDILHLDLTLTLSTLGL